MCVDEIRILSTGKMKVFRIVERNVSPTDEMKTLRRMQGSCRFEKGVFYIHQMNVLRILEIRVLLIGIESNKDGTLMYSRNENFACNPSECILLNRNEVIVYG